MDHASNDQTPTKSPTHHHRSRRRRIPCHVLILITISCYLLKTIHSYCLIPHYQTPTRLQRLLSLRLQQQSASNTDHDHDNDDYDDIQLSPSSVESLRFIDMTKLEETNKQIEQQKRQIDQLLQLVAAQQARNQTSQNNPTTLMMPWKAMLFIDGTWLYYSIHERNEKDCPIVQKFGKGWQQRYQFDWKALPRILSQSLNDEWNSQKRPVDIVRVAVFTSYKADTPVHSYRYQMFQDMKAANYDVHMMETVGKSEKCVDIALAVEMMHYATITPNAFDVALLLTGDKDFMPAMIRTRQKGRKVALVSMQRGCNRALIDTPGLKDYDVLWLEDYLDELIVPRSNGGYLSAFTFMKIINDFILSSGFNRVTSRDIGRYLKSLRVGTEQSKSVLEELKQAFGGLRPFLELMKVYRLTERENYMDPTDRAYWVEVLEPEAEKELVREAKLTKFSEMEKQFFDQYTLDALHDKQTNYQHTFQCNSADPIQLPEPIHTHPATELDLPEDLTIDYSKHTVAQLKERCRERGLPVSGLKTTLLERIQQDVEIEIQRIREEYKKKLSEKTEAPVISSFSTSIPQETADYLNNLIIEYLKASGGSSGSRNVGRYLAANKPKNPGYKSALHELKSVAGNLRLFINHFSDKFTREEAPLPLETDVKENRFEFHVKLKNEATV